MQSQVFNNVGVVGVRSGPGRAAVVGGAHHDSARFVPFEGGPAGRDGVARGLGATAPGIKEVKNAQTALLLVVGVDRELVDHVLAR